MRHLTLLRLLTLVLLTASTGPLRAAVYTWSQYDLTFETPDNGLITHNSPTRFEIRWDEVVMVVQLYAKDKDTGKKVFKENLRRKAANYGVTDVADGKVKVKGFKVYSIEGSLFTGDRVVIADLVPKKTDIIVEVTVTYLYGHREIVEEILESFTESKKPAKQGKHKQRVQSREDADRQQQQSPAPKPKPRRDEKYYDA